MYHMLTLVYSIPGTVIKRVGRGKKKVLKTLNKRQIRGGEPERKS